MNALIFAALDRARAVFLVLVLLLLIGGIGYVSIPDRKSTRLNSSH